MANIDERLEAVVQSVELMMLEGRQLLKSVTRLERSATKLEKATTKLAETAENHERRLTRLERGR